MTTPTNYSDFQDVQRSEQFQQLRSTHRSFVFPMTMVFLIWYLSFVIVAAFFPEFMAIKVLGNINLGIVLGLAQFVTTFIITGAYVAYANKKIDPIATDLREKMESAQATSAADDSFQTTAHGAGETA